MSNVEHLAEGVTLHLGDCLEVLDSLPENSIDAVVTDPPYELGFMGKSWDASGIAFRPETWAKIMRVLKPGGYLLAFGATKNYHRLACSIEDAGFEIRDCISHLHEGPLLWIQGQGFPKSLDISKAIDKAGGISPRVQAELLRDKREAAGMSRDELAAIIGCTPSSIRDWEEGRARIAGAAIEWIVPSDEYRARLAETLGYTNDERRIVGVSIDRRGDGTVYGVGHSGELRVGGNTDAAREWEGWGTALKPAVEFICVGRKPLSEGTVAANVLRWGTGAINIDATRIGDEQRTYDLKGGENLNRIAREGGGDSEDAKGLGTYGVGAKQVSIGKATVTGRWPANLCHDGSQEVLDLFPHTKSGSWNGQLTGRGSEHSGNWGKKDRPFFHNGDEGSAARFFYCSKASKHDRAGSRHPTVKPINLMRWLVRMVTPPGGTVLDPFAGSGTTGVAAVNEGFNIIMIEKEEEYQRDIRSRFNDGQK